MAKTIEAAPRSPAKDNKSFLFLDAGKKCIRKKTTRGLARKVRKRKIPAASSITLPKREGVERSPQEKSTAKTLLTKKSNKKGGQNTPEA